MRKPFYRTSHQCWYVVGADGKFIRLDPDETKAYEKYGRLLSAADYQSQDATIEAILEAWLESRRPTVSDRVYADFVRVCSSFAIHCGPTTFARKVKASDLLSWANSPKYRGSKWSLSRKRDAGRVIQRAYRWAIDRGFIPFNELLDISFASSPPRSHLIDYETHAKIMTHLRSKWNLRPFATFLIAIRHSGVRPIQAREITAKNVIGGAWVFTEHKTSKKTGKPMIVRLTPCLATLTRILIASRPKGCLFLNSRGDPYTRDAVVHGFRSIRESLGIEDITAYSYRHTFATDALLSGVDIGTVAALMGHSDSSMVARVYGHLDQASQHLENAIGKVAAKRASERKP
jgi:integrase